MSVGRPRRRTARRCSRLLRRSLMLTPLSWARPPLGARAGRAGALPARVPAGRRAWRAASRTPGQALGGFGRRARVGVTEKCSLSEVCLLHRARAAQRERESPRGETNSNARVANEECSQGKHKVLGSARGRECWTPPALFSPCRHAADADARSPALRAPTPLPAPSSHNHIPKPRPLRHHASAPPASYRIHTHSERSTD